MKFTPIMGLTIVVLLNGIALIIHILKESS